MSARLFFSTAFAKRMLFIAILIGMMISITLPMAYFAIQWHDLDRNMVMRGNEIAGRIRRSVRESPDLWFYGIVKFINIDADGENQPGIASIDVYDTKNRLRYAQKMSNDTAWTYAVRIPIRYNNEEYGIVEISESYEDIIVSTAWVTAASIILGISCAFVVYRYPVKLVRAAEDEVQNYTRQAKQRADDEVVRLDRLSTVGKMAAAIGHEIRNPLTTVRGYLQFFSMKKEFQGFDSQFRLMLEELDRSNSIITELLNLAHNKAVNMAYCQLNQTIEAMYPLILSDATLQGMSVELELQELPEIIADEKEIRQLILNLTRNGLEAMQSRGVLTIRTLFEQDSVILQIADQGSGIDPAVLAQLGTPFVTTKPTGTGLGLAVCYSIANRHKAKFEIASSPAGATCTVRFPLPQD